jgi:hypothetical protein
VHWRCLVQSCFQKLELPLAIALCSYALSLPGMAQQTSQQPQQQSTQRDQYRDQAQTTMEDQQQKNMESFPGTISEKYGKFFLQKAHSRLSFELVHTWDAKRFVGKKVRVTGWLDTEHNILHVTTIAKAP